uniref:Cyclin N-terminal domain-containing protein n=1 Tax=Neobodo designis TaxID=312471 RepID=A0A7S1QUB1_NEODS|eukprot:CAMPEP_0174852062 /NCGR_PEP_ID=MMETSP1114-20130205/25166_1 /TAXON_ID=312471 /ORGANISM="Neobodo designis, Strain CCAP 1951/1" /LENGTH=324 /DNA_ID=CAMNT_0016086637 /DNA_START=26 /DNA_END=1000 /DNA_ORIENTATION=-
MAAVFPLRERNENVTTKATLGDASVDSSGSPGATRRVANLAHHCGEYADEIVEHLLEREKTLHRDSSYLVKQDDVTERMRIILVDWLVDVHLKFKLHPETFFLAVDYVDRYLMVARGARSTLQLVGVCAMLLAAKHEEIWPPEVRECIYISANTYTREEILATERSIAAALNFRLCTPTPYPFMSRVLDCVDATEDVRNLAAYCLDIAALDYGSLQYLPSRIGFASVLIANVVTINNKRQSNALPALSLSSSDDSWEEAWPRDAAFYAKTDADQMETIAECARGILRFAATINSPNSRYHAVRRKFSSDRWGEVALRYLLPDTI